MAAFEAASSIWAPLETRPVWSAHAQGVCSCAECVLKLRARAAGGADKAKADFGLSGVLADESNMKNGVVQKYAEPDEKAIPDKRWRLYVFKNGARRTRPSHHCYG